MNKNAKNSNAENINNVEYDSNLNLNAILHTLVDDIVNFSSDEDPTTDKDPTTDVIILHSTKEVVDKRDDHPQVISMFLKDICDQCVPIHFQNIMNYLKNETFCDNEMLYLAAYILGLEMGFVCKSGYDVLEFCKLHNIIDTPVLREAPTATTLSTIRPYPIYWQKNEQYALQLYLINRNNVFKKACLLLLGSIQTGEMTFSLELDSNENDHRSVFEVSLLVPRYISSAWMDGDLIHKRFNRMTEFCYLLHANVFKPMYDYLT